MHVFPTDAEVKQATELIVNKYKVSAQLLGEPKDGQCFLVPWNTELPDS
jgi:hypothetical protein